MPPPAVGMTVFVFGILHFKFPLSFYQHSPHFLYDTCSIIDVIFAK